MQYVTFKGCRTETYRLPDTCRNSSGLSYFVNIPAVLERRDAVEFVRFQGFFPGSMPKKCTPISRGARGCKAAGRHPTLHQPTLQR